jgi:hypothetical protein
LEVRGDQELIYRFALERCHDRNCKSARRPIIVCE